MDFDRFCVRLEDLLNLVVTETDPDSLWVAARGWLADQGFDKVIHLAGAPSGAIQIRTSLGTAFEEDYRAEGFGRHDPFFSHCLTSDIPVATGVEYLDHYDLSVEQRQVILAAGTVGFRAGFSHVVRRDGLGWEAWNIGSSLGRRSVETLRRERELDLRLVLLAFRDRLTSNNSQVLSHRERECLDLLATGLRTKGIATALGLAEVTVDLHLRNARSKLGAATREQALLLYRGRA